MELDDLKELIEAGEFEYLETIHTNDLSWPLDTMLASKGLGDNSLYEALVFLPKMHKEETGKKLRLTPLMDVYVVRVKK